MPTPTLNTQGSALLPQNNGGQSQTTTGQQAFAAPTALNSFVNTLPSVPNPIPPPPKTLTVVTPKQAQADLAQKQDTTTAVSNAVQTQNQTNLAKVGVTTATTPVPGQTQQPQQQQNGQQAPANGTQQNNGAPAPSALPANATPQQILQAINAGQPVTLTRDQAQTLNGGDFTGYQMNPDGTFTPTLTQAQKSALNTQYGTNPSLPSTGDATTDYVNAQLAKNQQDADAASATHQQQLQQILSGQFPLTADQQAQVAGLQSQFDQLRTLQQQQNQNYVDATTILGIRSGAEQYAPAFAQGEVNLAINKGIQSLATLDAQASSAVAQLKSGFLNDDYTLINASYKDLTDALTAKDDTLKQINDNVQQAVKTQTDKINNQTAQLQLQTSAVNSIATSTLQQSLKADGTIDINALTDIANQNNVDPQALYGAVVKEQQAETIAQQGDAKFASDQLQAAATLANTKETTAKAANDIRLANSGTNPDGTPSAATQAYVTAIQNGNATLTNVPSAQRTAVAEALANTSTTSYSPLAASRFATASNRIVSNFTALPQYQLTANGLPYLQRIAAAEANPGSVSDQDLLDSLTKLNTAGNAISDAQVKLITDGRSFSDTIGVAKNKLGNGGVLSDNQRQQIQTIAQAIYANYAKGYQPVYDQVTAQLTAAGIPQPFWTIPDLNTLAQQSSGDYLNGGGSTPTPKATGQSDSAYVESTLEAQGKSYQDVISAIPSGQKGVIDNTTGEIGAIPPSEFDPSKYTPL